MQSAAPVAAPKSKAPLIIAIAGGSVALIALILVAVLFVIGSIGARLPTRPVGAGTSTSAPSHSSTPAPTGAGVDSDPSVISPVEQSYADSANNYFASYGLAKQDDAKIVAFGYKSCGMMEDGITKEEFIAYAGDHGTTDNEVRGIGYMFGAGVSVLCPQYTPIIDQWTSTK